MGSLTGGLIFAWQDAFLNENPMARRSGEPDLSLARRRLIMTAAAAICFPYGDRHVSHVLALASGPAGQLSGRKAIFFVLLEWFFRVQMAALFPGISFELPLPTRLHSTAARLPDLLALGPFSASAFVSLS